MSQLQVIIILIAISFAPISHAKELKLSSIKKAVRSYNGQIKSYKSSRGRLRSTNKLKGYVSSLTTKDRKRKFDYLFKLQDAYASVRTANISKGTCRFMRSELRFKFGYTPNTPRSRIKYPERHALNTINALCQ